MRLMVDIDELRASPAFQRGVRMAEKVVIKSSSYFDVMIDSRILEPAPSIFQGAADVALARIASRRRDVPKWKRLWLWWKAV